MKNYRIKIGLLFILAVFTFSACNPTTAPKNPPEASPIAIPIETAAPPTQPATTTPTLDSPTLQAGQSTFAFHHEGRGQVVLVNGGPERGKPANDPLELWGWDGRQWSLVAADTDGPTWRNWAAIAYDSTRDVLIIHGGLQGPAQRFSETWEWDGNTWTKFEGDGPGAREGSLMVYDSVRRKVVLFGGAEGMEINGDTWEWDKGTWTKVNENGPAPRFPGGMVFDTVRSQVLMYSGHFASTTGEFINYDDLWAWDGRSWKEIPAEGDTPGHRTHAAMVYDPQTQRILLFSGGMDIFMSDIWAWDGGGWTDLSVSGTPSRSGHSVAYDPRRDRFVLFGGIERPAQPAQSDTWEWDRTQWVCLSNCQ